MITDPLQLALIDFILAQPGARKDVQFPIWKGNATTLMWFDQRLFLTHVHKGDRIAVDGGGYVVRECDLETATGWRQWVYEPPLADLPMQPHPLRPLPEEQASAVRRRWLRRGGVRRRSPA